MLVNIFYDARLEFFRFVVTMLAWLILVLDQNVPFLTILRILVDFSDFKI